MFGLYRTRCGGEIVQSFYDFDKQQIGPYKIPIKLNYIPERSCYDVFEKYRYYEELVKSFDALAIFNINNYCFVIIERCRVYQVPYSKTADTTRHKLELLSWNLPEPLDVPVYNHIGYIKTFHKCKAVSQYPTYLVQDAVTGEIPGFTEKLNGVPLVDPPLSLYRELINSDAKAVYFDTISNETKFLKY